MCLGLYRKIANEVSVKHDITRTEFEILLFGYDYEHFNRTALVENVPCSFSTLKKSLAYLVENQYIRVIRERAHFKSRLYSLTRKSRLMITKFYNQMNIN